MYIWAFRKWNRVAVICCLALLFQTFALLVSPVHTYAADTPDLQLEVKAAVLMEASTGQVLYEYNADTPLPPASMAKMMTEFLSLEAISAGTMKMDQTLLVSDYASKVGGSGQLLGPGEKMSVQDVMTEMSVYSGNDGAVVLAEQLAGTEENFAKQMNDTAKQLGMTNTRFINATGLDRSDMGKNAPASIDGETMMSAKDAATLARAIVTKHKDFLNFTSITSKKLRPKDAAPMINWNRMLEGWKTDGTYYRNTAYEGMDGLKTGHTDRAGYCFTGTAERNGMRLISVVMGTESREKSFSETKKIMDYGFNSFEVNTVLAAKSEIESMKTVQIKKGIQTEVPVVTQDGVQFIVKKAEKPDIQIAAQPIEEAKLVAPIKQGDVLGTVKVTYNGITKETNLIATQNVEKGSWIRLFGRAIKNFFGDIFSSIAGGIKSLF